MNKRKIAFFIIIIMLSLIGFTVSKYDSSVNKSDKPVAKITNNTTLLKERIIQLPKKYNKAEVEKIITRLSKINNHVLQILADKNIHIRLINGKVTDEPEYSYLKGVLIGKGHGSEKWDDIPGVGGNPVIIKIGYIEPSEYIQGYSNLELHEAGHAVDMFCFSNISMTKEFREIIGKEKDSIFNDPGYGREYPDEYFAEAFSMYYFSDESRAYLKYTVPEIYKFLDKILNK